MTQTVNKLTWTNLGAGKYVDFGTGGAEIEVWKLQGASEIDIKFDDNEDIPFAQGRGLRIVHRKIRVTNNNADPVTFVILQATEGGQVSAFIDNLDTATQVSLSGAVSLVNSPFLKEGGNVMPVGNSSFDVSLDASGGATAQTIISSAANVNGVYVYDLQLVSDAAPVGSRYGVYFICNGISSYSPLAADDQGRFTLGRSMYLKPGVGLSMSANEGTHNGRGTYEIL